MENVVSLREKLSDILEKELEQLPELMKDLKPKDRINIIMKMASIVTPKTQAIHWGEDGKSIF